MVALLFRLLTSGTYTLKSNVTQKKYEVYCHMATISECGSGGWTLVMKVDGNEVNRKELQCKEVYNYSIYIYIYVLFTTFASLLYRTYKLSPK